MGETEAGSGKAMSNIECPMSDVEVCEAGVPRKVEAFQEGGVGRVVQTCEGFFALLRMTLFYGACQKRSAVSW